MSQMSDYEFTLTFSLPESDAEQYLDALFEAGCDDALIGIGQAGSIALDFVRDSESASMAVESAIENVKAAIPAAELIEVKPAISIHTETIKTIQRGTIPPDWKRISKSHNEGMP